MTVECGTHTCHFLYHQKFLVDLEENGAYSVFEKQASYEREC